MAILSRNLSICQKLLKNENQKHKKSICSEDQYLCWRFCMGKRDNLYGKDDNDHLGFHFTKENMSYETCRTFSDKTTISFDSTGDLKWTAFHFASLAGDCEVLRFLFRENVPGAYHKNNENQTCLHIAALNGRVGISKCLIEGYDFNLNIDVADEREWTPLHCAAYSGNYKLFRYLLGKGSDPFKKTKDRDNCLHIASYYGHLRICKLILFQSQLNGPSSIILNSPNLDGNTSLHKAALTRQLKIYNLLLVYDADFTIKNKSNERAQDLAARNNQQEISLLLNEKSGVVG